jgi:hypothetical protein
MPEELTSAMHEEATSPVHEEPGSVLSTVVKLRTAVLDAGEQLTACRIGGAQAAQLGSYGGSVRGLRDAHVRRHMGEKCFSMLDVAPCC